ncbi:GNAT family N-acetyltransferase [Leptolyngbya sp. FACHB-671]|uniref:GNAT family N-acetyltransferase n=1 Tax=Leptolyngbya sp. FACHB-671 TaxID=2692812 RepID=UPI001682304D|nr:GNAT family N-acetyltransferase [Leptolyngbya sp. FACHB-671]MBD2071282.1 GNAT family N-acetyltransferase [Leptolyngbya sp. FACHB-671]
MYQFLQIENSNQLTELSRLSGLSALDAQSFVSHSPDAHWVLVEEGAIAGRCSLWWRNVPPYPEQKLGLIGHYAVQNADAAHRLLDHACQQLLEQGCTMAVAPIDGNTWRRYRLLSERGSEPVFFLEPDNPDEWRDQVRAKGFTVLTHYSSAMNSDLTQQDSRLERVAGRLEELEVRVRSLNLQQFGSELEKIYRLCLTSFRQNFLYTPIAFPEFAAQYSQILPHLQPELVLMAEHEGRLVGFLFAIPDLFQAKRGEKISTVIIKTVAVLPDRQYAGLGNFLVAECQAIAHQRGYSRAIHALMHDENNSRSLSRHYAQTIRGYTLFAKSLTP